MMVGIHMLSKVACAIGVFAACQARPWRSKRLTLYSTNPCSSAVFSQLRRNSS